MDLLEEEDYDLDIGDEEEARLLEETASNISDCSDESLKAASVSEKGNTTKEPSPTNDLLDVDESYKETRANKFTNERYQQEDVNHSEVSNNQIVNQLNKVNQFFSRNKHYNRHRPKSFNNSANIRHQQCAPCITPLIRHQQHAPCIPPLIRQQHAPCIQPLIRQQHAPSTPPLIRHQQHAPCIPPLMSFNLHRPVSSLDRNVIKQTNKHKIRPSHMLSHTITITNDVCFDKEYLKRIEEQKIKRQKLWQEKEVRRLRNYQQQQTQQTDNTVTVRPNCFPNNPFVDLLNSTPYTVHSSTPTPINMEQVVVKQEPEDDVVIVEEVPRVPVLLCESVPQKEVLQTQVQRVKISGLPSHFTRTEVRKMCRLIGVPEEIHMLPQENAAVIRFENKNIVVKFFNKFNKYSYNGHLFKVIPFNK